MSTEYQYLVDRYAQSLTKYDSKALLERSKGRTGSLTAAAKEADITRKTVYDWENSTDDVKTLTKRKILEANFEADYHGTLDFLTRKAAIDYNEILQRYVNAKLDKISKANDPQEFKNEVSDLEKYLKAHSGAILDIRTLHMDEAIKMINDKACSLGVQGIPEGINFISPHILSQKFLHLLEVICLKTMFKEEIAERLNLPLDFVDQACKVARYVNPVGNIQEDLQEQLSERNRVIPIGIREVSFETPHTYSLKARKY